MKISTRLAVDSTARICLRYGYLHPELLTSWILEFLNS